VPLKPIARLPVVVVCVIKSWPLDEDSFRVSSSVVLLNDPVTVRSTLNAVIAIPFVGTVSVTDGAVVVVVVRTCVVVGVEFAPVIMP
jgi:hypothetical protein